MLRAICKLIKKSPKRETHLECIKEKANSKAKGIHTVCPTRWTVRGEACAAIANYTYLYEPWEWSLGLAPDSKSKPDSEMCAKILGAHLNKRILRGPTSSPSIFRVMMFQLQKEQKWLTQ
jgi:hypothetical protein